MSDFLCSFLADHLEAHAPATWRGGREGHGKGVGGSLRRGEGRVGTRSQHLVRWANGPNRVGVGAAGAARVRVGKNRGGVLVEHAGGPGPLVRIVALRPRRRALRVGAGPAPRTEARELAGLRRRGHLLEVQMHRRWGSPFAGGAAGAHHGGARALRLRRRARRAAGKRVGAAGSRVVRQALPRGHGG